MSPEPSIVDLSSLTSWQEVVLADMLLYTTATNPYYFPVVILPVLVLCLRLVHAVSDTPIQHHNTLTCSLPVQEVHSTCNHHNCWSFLFSLHFADLGDQGYPAVQLLYTHILIHASFTIHTTSSPLPSDPPTQNSLSLLLCIQGGHLHSICQLSHLFLGLLLNSNEKVMEGIISAVFLGSSQHCNSNCSHTHRSTQHCTCIFIVAID